MTNNIKQIAKAAEVEERQSALLSNAAAIQALASAVEGTLGPKGLDCMLVDRLGDVTITNDGSAILDKIDINHPAARMLVRAAKAQEEEVGDGTTTATILASALIAQAANHIGKGVPVTKVIEGIGLGTREAASFIEEQSVGIQDLTDPMLRRAALISGRGNEDIADLVVKAAQMVGIEKLLDPGFRLSGAIVAEEGAANEVFNGLIIDKEPMNKQMPRDLRDVRVMIVDDALEPEKMEDEAMRSESGFARYAQHQDEFAESLRRIPELGVRFVAVAKGIHDTAEEALTEAGVMAVRRVSSRDIARLAEHTGARPIKRSGLKKDTDELAKFVGSCLRVYQDERLEHVRIVGGTGKPAATILVGASTREVRDERERIAQDAAAAAQAAVRGGVVAGGGAVEIGAARNVQRLRENVKGMAAYGVDCVEEALKRPLAQIVANAGFNPLEKVEDVISAQSEHGNLCLAVDCDDGAVSDMMKAGVVDPTAVKLHALKAAAEIADAVLRINTIIRKRSDADTGNTNDAP
ncbi:MAG: TCP-1/cpn60 chaperonin family protein [Armatimonadota bacterium]|nr:TCP-1/cpn60 chaperonin family protein [Armatimonadota bacterium]